MINFSDFNPDPTGVQDCKAAFDAAIAAVAASTTTRTLNLGLGMYRFASAPNPIACAVNLVGEGKGVTHLIKDFSGAPWYFLNRIQNTVDKYGGGSIKDMEILASANCVDGIAIWVQATPDAAGITQWTRNPHGLLIDNVIIGPDLNGGSWQYGIYLDGSSNPGPGAPGIRSVRMRNVGVNAATVASYVVNNGAGTDAVIEQASNCPCGLSIINGYGTMITSRTIRSTLGNIVRAGQTQDNWEMGTLMP